MTPNSLFSQPVTFSGTTSAAFTLGGEFAIVGMIIPAGFTSATLTFQVSMTPLDRAGEIAAGATYADLYDDTGNAVSVTAAASRAITLGWNVYMPGVSFKIVSSASQTLPITVIYRS